MIWIRFLRMILATSFLVIFLAGTVLAEERPTGWQCPGGDCSRNAANNNTLGDWHGYPGHVGIDYMRSSGFPVYAVEHGVIEDYNPSLQYYGNACGATGGAMLVHHIAKGYDGYSRSFWSVYGHMYKKSSLKIGDIVEKGEVIGYLLYYTGPSGSCDEDWSHLHFGIHPDNVPAIGANRFRGIASTTASDDGWIHPENFLDANLPGNWDGSDSVDCNKLESKYPDVFQQKGITSCQNAQYFYPNQYVISDGTKCVWFQVNSSSQVIASSDNIPPGIGYGGGGTPFALPDFIVKNVWLENQAGSTAEVFSPGDRIKVNATVKNVGADSPHDIKVKYYISDGEHVQSGKQQVGGTDNIRDYNMGKGESQTESEEFNAPTLAGTYNIVACADADDDVEEEHESNNCSTEAVFIVNDVSWLLNIINIIMDDN